MKLTTIYVELENEGIIVFRPTFAKEVETGVFEIQKELTSESEDEAWKFPPGSLVKGEMRHLGGEDVWVAIAR